MGYREDTLKYYNDNAYDFVRGTLDADMTNIYSQFEKYINKGAFILDLGCGAGRDSKYFSSKGYKVMPVDGSSEICRIATDISGIQPKCIDFRDIDFADEFDAVWACASLLHISENELPKVIGRINNSLKNEGILYASFKYGRGTRTKNGRFFFDCDESLLKGLFNETTGFCIIETFVTEDVREGRSSEKWMNVIARKTNMK